MRKILPVIIVLIGLSLIGLIILQGSWLKNLVQLRAAQISSKINEASSGVVLDLSRTVYNSRTTKTPRKLKGLSFGNDMFNILKPKMVSEQFSLQDIQHKITAAFKDEELKRIHFDFAIISSNNEYEMQTPNFEKSFFDTASNKPFIFPIFPGEGTDFEGLNVAEHLVIVVPNFKQQVWGTLTWIVLGSGVFTIIIFAAFFITVRTLINQKKISEIKSDFINNMTHEFKTPIATISLAVDAIKNQKVLNDPQKLQYFTGIIKDENTRMNKHVETILQAALLEKKELQLNLQPTSANIIVASVVDNFQLQLSAKNGTCQLNLDAIEDTIIADESHFSNAISNLVDNAIKYSEDNLKIIISSYNKNNKLVITIKDNGIGMSKETVKNIFEKFYRAHTGNVHNVKGFGLGMSYVKTIVDALKGTIKVESTLHKGTQFTIELPIAKNAKV
ncbi:MAG: HAMP domain-containing histidine kinase [Chitinophagaceae bacterium]|nr:HAMP domain-containing histidine kinase [Chitinophagaceae bacterium]